MGAMRLDGLSAPKKIRHPEELSLPPADKVRTVLAELQPQGGSLFLAELLEALRGAVDMGDLAPVQHVVDAWYRTLLFKLDPRHEHRWEGAIAAGEKPPPGLSPDEVRKTLGINP